MTWHGYEASSRRPLRPTRAAAHRRVEARIAHPGMAVPATATHVHLSLSPTVPLAAIPALRENQAFARAQFLRGYFFP